MEENLEDISFGALAEAQAQLGPTRSSRKRKVDDIEPQEDENSDDDDDDGPPEAVETGQGYKGYDGRHVARSSKHAPTVSSTRNPVSRKRTIFSPPPASKSRDPRFDATTIADARYGNTSSTAGAARNYAFLSDYQAAEILDLKAQIKKTRNLDQQAELKRQVMSLEAKLRNAQIQKREAEILQEHKQKERAAIKEGTKSRPYYLKQSDVRKQIDQERQDAMGKRAKDKAEKRKKKREKTKEAKDMPRQRRVI